MNKFDLLKLSLGNLWRRKIRTVLTILGVVIGTSSIVVMISLGLAMDVGFQNQLQEMGDLNIIEVYEKGGGEQQKEKIELNEKYVSQMRQLPGVEAVMASRSVYLRIIIDKKVCDFMLQGIDPTVQEAFGFQAQEGRLLQPGDKDAIVFGNYIKGWFRNPRSNSYESMEVNVLTDSIEATTNMSYGERRRSGKENPTENNAKLYRVKGVGILEISNGSSDYQGYASLTLVDKILQEQERERNTPAANTKKYETVKVKAQSLDDVEQVQESIKDMGFQTYSMIEMVKQMQQTSRRMQAILGGIGAISLLVAGIGITNTMIMSIYERTREIGVMKVLGATLKDIRDLFLIESGFIGLAGGVVGILLSYGVSLILNHFGSGFMDGYMYGGNDSVGISVITWQLAVGAVIFAVLIGLLAGLSPARRAMNMPVLKALKSVE